MIIFVILFTYLNFILCEGILTTDINTDNTKNTDYTDYTDNIDNTNYIYYPDYSNCANYTKITLYRNGTVKDEAIFIDKEIANTIEHEMLSIVDGNKLIIYENNNSQSICSYSNTENSNVSLDDCNDLTPKVKEENKNNLCCLLETNDTKGIIDNRCVQVNKYEINRFRGITKNILNYYKQNNKFNKNLEYDRVGILTCYSKYYKINELLFLSFYLYF